MIYKSVQYDILYGSLNKLRAKIIDRIKFNFVHFKYTLQIYTYHNVISN